MIVLLRMIIGKRIIKKGLVFGKDLLIRRQIGLIKRSLGEVERD